MKTSAVLASLLFGSFAVAAPFDKRALVYKTEIVTETVVVYTTVYDDVQSVAEATTTSAGYFYEQPKAPSSAAAQPTPEAPVAQELSSTYVAPAPVQPTPVVEPVKPVVQTPSPVVGDSKPVETTQPAPTSTYVAPEPVYSAAPAPAPAPAPAASPADSASGSGMVHTNVDMTIYDNNGGFGACGTELHDTDMIVALAKDTWGASTYNPATGAATNPWCGQRIKIEYNGNHIFAKIMDLCPGCKGADIDLSLAAWKELTKLDEKTRLKASWSPA